MVDITRRGFVTLVGAGALALAGCSSGDDYETKAEDESKKKPKTQLAEVGDAVDAKTKSGDLRLTVEGFETSEELRQQEATYNRVADGETIGVLKLLVENVSYDDGSGFVQLDSALRVTDPDGVTMTPMSSAWPYGQYEAAAGAVIECAVGETKRVAVQYLMDTSTEGVTIVISSPKTEVRATVERA